MAKDIIDVVIRNMNLGTTDAALTKKKNPDLTLFEWSNRELDVIFLQFFGSYSMLSKTIL